jgi:hypothetical protein
VLLCLGIGADSLYAAGEDDEYRLKVALLYKLTKFVHWPETEARAQAEHFNLCLIGRNPLGSALQAVEGRKAKDKPLAIVELGALSETSACDMAFVSRDGLVRFPGVTDALGAHSVLSISDQRGFAAQGGMVELARKGKRLAFRVNRKNAEEAGIRFSAPFLGIATLVGD